MKKSIIFTLCLVLFSFIAFAGKFVLIPVSETNNLETLFSHNDLTIHYYCDDYVLATTDNLNFNGVAVLDENAFADVGYYAIVYCYEKEKDEYLERIAESAKSLYSGNHFFIMKILSADDFSPAKNDGIVTIRNVESKLTKTRFDFPVLTEVDENIQYIIDQTSTDRLMADVLNLQNYETRRYDHAKSVVAQNWIREQFESMEDLSVSIQTLTLHHNLPPASWCGTALSGNVIAIQQGTEFPNEYIVCGCHYDSYSSTPGNEPGADDNATGTAGILETARILSQYDFKRSIIYCTFTAEECGLDGSWNYAKQCADQGMDIVGYFNIDMSGYLQSGTTMHIDLIHPTSANPLANYYKNVANIYFPGLQVTSYPNLSGGDSDHTSFNQSGYMGIFPFEDSNNHSPYIHTTNDLIGPSVNTPEQVKLFTQMNLASIATLAILNDSYPILSLSKKSSSIEINSGQSIDDYITVYNLGDTPLTFEIKDIDFDFYKFDIEPLEGTVQPLDSLTITLSYFFPALVKTEDREFFGSFNFICNDPTQEKTEISLYALAHIESNINDTELSAFNIYPNPAKNELWIESAENKGACPLVVEVFDIYGRKLTPHTSYLTPHTLVDISELAAGIYFIRINDRFTGKFVKE